MEKPSINCTSEGICFGHGEGFQKPSAEKNETRDFPFCSLDKVLIIHLWDSPVEKFWLASEGLMGILPVLSPQPEARGQ